MSQRSTFRKIRHGLLVAMVGLGSSLCGCSMDEVWRAVQSGALDAIKVFSAGLVGAFLPNFNEIFNSIPGFVLGA